MSATAKAIRVSPELEREIEREAEQSGKSWSETTSELLEEALRMRRVPGIVFADGPSGRRAVIAGSGLDAWEVIATWKHGDQGFETLRRNYSWLTEAQLRAALSYYDLYPEEIDARLAVEAKWTPERIKATVKSRSSSTSSIS